MQRIIGRYSGEQKGPLLICLAGIHGNEPAGIHALELMFKMLEVEPITNPKFAFKGRIVGLRGNLKAIREGKRFIEKDLNRQWTKDTVEKCKTLPISDLLPEEQEIKELISLIEEELASYQPEKFVLLDLHTTTATGGIFSVATDDRESVRIGVELHAPVVKGLLQGIKGTTLHYFNNRNFQPDTVAVCFESGQHQEPLSVNRAIAAITNCLRTIGCVRAEDVENRHDELLIEYSRQLPKVTELINCHAIKKGDEFRMEPGYLNFQAVKKGEVLAHDRKGPVTASTDGYILMPLYQKQGDDGFFLVRKVSQF
ncbi:MAG: succinylglutamate desuccinylase/aspartoacylase family protein [Saprospiraceae bacterium]|nr:succinylglutamate desuccinylase/aspartoacylase family protein [Saprospiraceae bacterium]